MSTNIFCTFFKGHFEIFSLPLKEIKNYVFQGRERQDVLFFERDLICLSLKTLRITTICNSLGLQIINEKPTNTEIGNKHSSRIKISWNTGEMSYFKLNIGYLKNKNLLKGFHLSAIKKQKMEDNT